LEVAPGSILIYKDTATLGIHIPRNDAYVEALEILIAAQSLLRSSSFVSAIPRIQPGS
jgi:hypothetical protein